MSDLITRLEQARLDSLASGEAPRIPYDWLVPIISALKESRHEG